jgi:hypothetical protein
MFPSDSVSGYDRSHEDRSMRTWLVVVVATVAGIGAGLAIGTVRIRERPWDGTPAGVLGMSRDQVALDAAAALQPVAEVPVAQFNFGLMNTTDVGKRSFIVRNAGKANLTLERGATTCRCTLADVRKNVLAPGESTEVVLEWRVQDFFGTYEQSATVMTNDPRRNQIRFTVSGEVAPVIRASPSEVNIASLTVGTSRTQTVQLFCYRPEQVKIEGWEFSDPAIAGRFEVKLEPMPADQVASEKSSQSGYLAHLTVKPGLPLGPFQQTITLRTNVSAASALPVLVKGTVVADISLSGQGVDASGGVVLGTLTSQEDIERTILIYTRGPHYKDVNFKVLSTEPGFLQATVGQTTVLNNRALSQTPMTIRIPKGAPPADHLGSDAAKPARITLETGHPQAPQFQITVRFAVRN